MNQKVKETATNILGSLVSNDSAINGAKTAPWWMALILGVIGCFLPVIPSMVSASNTYGAGFLASNTYGYENQVTKATNKLEEEGYQLLVYNKSLQVKKNGTVLNPEIPVNSEVVSEDMTPIIATANAYTNQIDFEIYYSRRSISSKDSATITDLVTYINTNHKYFIGTDKLEAECTEEELAQFQADSVGNYIPSFTIFYTDGIYTAIKVNNSIETYVTSYTGYKWDQYEDGTDLVKKLSVVEDVTKDLNNEDYIHGVLNNWKELYNVSFETQKTSNFWATSGIYYGIYILLAALMGFMIWLLTRGKKNMFNYLKVGTCMSIEAWCVFCPGLLSMILGFFLSQYVTMMFVLFVGIRTMWLSMKQLRPQY